MMWGSGAGGRRHGGLPPPRLRRRSPLWGYRIRVSRDRTGAPDGAAAIEINQFNDIDSLVIPDAAKRRSGARVTGCGVAVR